jgi:hypothetical protein
MKTANINFVRLGSRDSNYKKLQVSDKAFLLNYAVKSGLPVPHGIVVLDEVWDRLQALDVLQLEGSDVHVTSADFFLESMALHKLKHAVVVREAFGHGMRGVRQWDRRAVSIQPGETEKLIHTLIDMWQAGADWATRRDTIIMEWVDGLFKGHATTVAADSADTVTSTDCKTNTTATRTFSRLTRWQRATETEPHNRRLQKLLRGVRHSFNLKGSDWRIEWIDDGKVCWLVEIEPVQQKP